MQLVRNVGYVLRQAGKQLDSAYNVEDFRRSVKALSLLQLKALVQALRALWVILDNKYQTYTALHVTLSSLDSLELEVIEMTEAHQTYRTGQRLRASTPTTRLCSSNTLQK